MTAARLRIELASPRIASTLGEGLEQVRRWIAEASGRGAEIVCFPEAYLPGLRGQDFEVPPFDRADQERALEAVAEWSREGSIATILGMERHTEAGRQIAVFVIDAGGRVLGFQTKNQLDPTEGLAAAAVASRPGGRESASLRTEPGPSISAHEPSLVAFLGTPARSSGLNQVDQKPGAAGSAEGASRRAHARNEWALS